MSRSVNLTVTVEDDKDLPNVMEIVARLMAGIALEGVDVRMYVYTLEDEDEDADV